MNSLPQHVSLLFNVFNGGILSASLILLVLHRKYRLMPPYQPPTISIPFSVRVLSIIFTFKRPEELCL